MHEAMGSTTQTRHTWYMAVIPALGRQREEDQKVKISSCSSRESERLPKQCRSLLLSLIAFQKLKINPYC